MEKIALIELAPTSVKLTFIQVDGGAYHKVLSQFEQLVRFDEEIYERNVVTDYKLAECNKVLLFYKELCQKQDVSKVYAFATSIFLNINNFKPFFDDIYRVTGFVFNHFTDEEEAKLLYNAMLNTVDVVKGVSLYINPHNCYVVSFSKRNLFSLDVLPMGSNSLSYLFKNSMEDAPDEVTNNMIAAAKEEIEKLNVDLSEHETPNFIGAGSIFVSLSALVRKMTKYPLEVDNNFHCKIENFDKAFNMLKDFGFDKTKKIGGISSERLDNVMAGFCIIKAFAEVFNVQSFNISTKTLSEAYISHKIIKESASETLKADVLDMSLANIRYFNQPEGNNIDFVNSVMQTIFKQLTIIHKLERREYKILKVATAMYDCGKRINEQNHTKFSKDIILNSKLYGVSHRELVTAAFACQCQNLDNFSLADWVKYNGIVDAEDLDVARKIGCMVGLSAALDVTKLSRVKYLECDILGDIIIIKVKGEPGEDLSYEKLEAAKVANNFKRVFKKTFQII